jgi:hypothetical protein
MVFGETIFAISKNTIGWNSPTNVVHVKGDVSGLGSYTFTHQGTLIAATTLDISTDNTAVGNPRYFVVRPQCCGSWQTLVGTGAGRDSSLS